MDLFDLLSFSQLWRIVLHKAFLAQFSDLLVPLDCLEFLEQLNELPVLALVYLRQHQRRVPCQLGLQRPAVRSLPVSHFL